ncbi:MAG: metallophosphoesterase [Ruminococcus sp.]|nr:metallophosphoesterase [Ruminococcus sp.]
MKWITALLAAGAALAGVSCLTGNRQLSVEEETVYCRSLPENFEGLRIVLIADLHKKKFGKGQCCLIDSVRAAHPDIIVFAGDLYSRSDKDPSDKVKLMKELGDIAPVYYSAGNHEINDPDLFEALCHKLKSIGINVLRNRLAVLTRGRQRLNIYGLQLPLKYYVNKDGSYRDLPEATYDDMLKYLGRIDKQQCNLLIAHDPLFFEAYEQWGADLVMSGHVHGGVIRLPFIGGLFSPERKLFPKYSKGLYRIGNSTMAVTTGLGKFRFNNPSQIMVLNLTSRKKPKKHFRGRPWEL